MTPLSMSKMGLGTGRLVSLGSSLTRSQSNALIHAAIDHGIRVIDTADTYASGDSERAVGAALKERRRDEAYLITKAGFPHVALPGFLSPLNQLGKKLVQKVSPRKNFSKAYLLRAMERSLRRLGTDYVDAFLLHSVAFGETSSETWEALETIRAKGMSRLTGISTTDARCAREGIEAGQVSLVESSISPASSTAQAICELCSKFEIPLVANEIFKPLPRLHTEAWVSLQQRFSFGSISRHELLIAYAAAQPSVATVLVGTRSPAHLVANQKGLLLKDLDPAIFSEMRAIVA